MEINKYSISIYEVYLTIICFRLKNINNKILLPQMTGIVHILIHTHSPERIDYMISIQAILFSIILP